MACAKGHVYPLLLVRLALTWACEAHTSYRGIALIFASLRGVVAAVGPCAETIRLWLLRVGLFLLRRPLPRCLDWVFLVDLTIQLVFCKVRLTPVELQHVHRVAPIW